MKFLLPDETAKQIADHLAREIFAVGDESSGPATRIQFMLGKWPDHERAAGGLCEIALASVIHSRLRMWPAPETSVPHPPFGECTAVVNDGADLCTNAAEPGTHRCKDHSRTGEKVYEVACTDNYLS